MSAGSRVDFHCHILPKADHGSDSVETSLSQVRNALGAGVGCVIATPHFYHRDDTVSSFLERREECAAALRTAMEEQALSLHIELAGEVAISHHLADMEGLEKLSIGNSKYILLEMPDTYWTQWVFDAIYYIESVRRLTPIIAHVDRYDPRQVQKLFEMSLLAQINAESAVRLSRRFQLRRWILDSKVHFLGSDTHGPGKESYAAFAKSCNWIERATDNTFMLRSARLLAEIHRGDAAK